MKIAIVTNTRPHEGGLTTDTNSVASALRQVGHDVDIFTIFGRSHSRKTHKNFVRFSDSLLKGKGSKAVIAYMLANFALLIHVLIGSIKKKYHIYYAMDFSAVNTISFVPAFRKRLFFRVFVKATIDLLIQSKVKEGTCYHRFFVGQELKAYHKAFKITPNSNWSYNFLKRIVPPEKLSQPCHTPIDVGFLQKNYSWREDMRKKWACSDNDFVILFPGRLSHRKGPHILIEALSLLAQKKIMFKAVLLGKGQEENRIKDLIRQKGLENNIVMPGAYSRDDIPRFNSGADCFVLPILPINDSMPISILEAMASELPVIASATAGIDHFITHAQDGFLIHPGDPVALSQQIKSLAACLPEERLKIGKAARTKVISECSPKKVAQELIMIFKEGNRN